MGKNSNETWAIIPARSGSKGVPDKNIKMLAGHPLIAYSIQAAKKTSSIARVIVSTDSNEYAKIAENYGYEVHLRDPYYSTSHAPMSEVYSYIASQVKSEHVAWINVTNPLAGTKIYDKAVDIYKKIYRKHDCLLSACMRQENFFYRGKFLIWDFHI